jgi:hypothetical protein
MNLVIRAIPIFGIFQPGQLKPDLRAASPMMALTGNRHRA